jgi:hypothetical protein
MEQPNIAVVGVGEFKSEFGIGTASHTSEIVTFCLEQGGSPRFLSDASFGQDGAEQE